MTAYNAEAEVSRGRFLEVGRYLDALPIAERDREGNLLLAGRVGLARGDSIRARRALRSALDLSLSPAARADAEWALAQAEIQSDDFREAAAHAALAIRSSLQLSPGFVRFLEGLSGAALDAGAAPGQRFETEFEMGSYALIRFPVAVNGVSADAVLDTGASYSIVTRSFAERAGVREIAGSDAFGLGLHQKPIPLTFGVIEELTLAGAVLRTVPVMIMPDDALAFETARGPLPISAVLGLHLLKDFSLEIDYPRQRIAFTRSPAGLRDLGPDQNLFFARGKVMARVTVDDLPWTLFLFDTGSELTMLTEGGVERLGLRTAAGVFPKRVEGIGKSSVSWGKVPRVSVGMAGYRLRFRDMVVAETVETLEDGVLGSSALVHFRVRIDFHRMKLELEERLP